MGGVPNKVWEEFLIWCGRSPYGRSPNMVWKESLIRYGWSP